VFSQDFAFTNEDWLIVLFVHAAIEASKVTANRQCCLPFYSTVLVRGIHIFPEAVGHSGLRGFKE
jgi:hypothetical protein